VEQLPETWLRPLQTVWHDWTQGELVILPWPGSNGDGEAAPGDVPKEAVRALEKGAAPVRWEDSEGRRWWGAPVEAAEVTFALLAGWSQGQDDWGKVLASWSGLLGNAFAEHQAAEGLTDELLQAWDRLKFVYHLIEIASEGREAQDVLGPAVRLAGELVDSPDVFLAARTSEDTWRYWTARAIPPAGLDEVAEMAAARSRPTRLQDLPRPLRQAASLLAGAEDLLIVPLPGIRRAEGVLGVVRFDRRFSASDVQLVVTAAEQIGLLLEGARVREAREATRRVEVELALASQIQASMLPEALPDVPGVELAAAIRPAYRFGGDFYDVAHGRDGQAFLLLGDVAGKGIAAAMLTALVHASFQSLAPAADSPGDLLTAMNRLMRSDLERAESFITAAIVALDSDGRAFSYASAGHVPAVRWQSAVEGLEMIPATGLPLGVWADEEYRSQKVKLEESDVLLLYTDGVTEALDGTGKLLGQQGLADLLYAAHPAPAYDQVRFFLEALELYRGDRPLADDVGILVIRKLPGTTVLALPFVYASEPSAVGRVVDLVRRSVEQVAGYGKADRRRLADEFALAVAEVVANQVRHAYADRPGRIQGSLRIGPSEWVADLYDIGRPFKDPGEAWPEPDPADPPLRGYGLRLVRGLVDRHEYRRLDEVRNHWRLIKRLPGG
jgi:serine phosphatase RsbU (regulator of sigma subunit)/anti-sigma regulatory factor (Ser/Thr protein kinase)